MPYFWLISKKNTIEPYRGSDFDSAIRDQPHTKETPMPKGYPSTPEGVEHKRQRLIAFNKHPHGAHNMPPYP